MSGLQSALTKLIVFFFLCFPQVCISKTLNSGRQKRYTEGDICLESKKTLEKVSTCPTNDNAFKERSEKKNCNTLPSCAGKPLVYHCVISEGMLIEVCSPMALITGRCCPFYNWKLGRVIDDFENRCQECPFQYRSDQYINNSECVKPGINYDLSEETTNINQAVGSPNEISKYHNPRQNRQIKETNKEHSPIALWIAIGIMIKFVLVLVIMCTYCFYYRVTKVRDRSINNTDRQGSLKPQFNDLMVRGSGEPMIENEECAM